MSFGLNQASLIGRIGADVTVRQLTNGGKVANFSLATDESYVDKHSGQRIDRAEWHRVTTFQPGLVDMLAKHCRKGRLAFVQGKLQTRRWTDQAGHERTTTEVLLVPGAHVRFLDKAPAPDAPGPVAAPPEDTATDSDANIDPDDLPF